MDFNKPSTVEEILIRELSTSGKAGEALLEKVRVFKKTFTKQALYLSLRKLTEREVVVKHGKTFSLSQMWLQKMENFFVQASHQYGIAGESKDFLSLTDGDKVSYSFKSPVESDKFWAHVFNTLGLLLSCKEPLYAYNPHEWFFFARRESEVFIFKELQKKKQQIWMICAGNSILDTYVSKYFDGKILQYYVSKQEIFEARNYYLNIFGDYILEARIDENVAKEVDEYYINATAVTEQTERDLARLLGKGKTTITISRNKKKAEKLKRIFTPYFYRA